VCVPWPPTTSHPCYRPQLDAPSFSRTTFLFYRVPPPHSFPDLLVPCLGIFKAPNPLSSRVSRLASLGPPPFSRCFFSASSELIKPKQFSLLALHGKPSPAFSPLPEQPKVQLDILVKVEREAVSRRTLPNPFSESTFSLFRFCLLTANLRGYLKVLVGGENEALPLPPFTPRFSCPHPLLVASAKSYCL